MRMGVDATRLLAECGQAPFANRDRHMHEVRFRFHNVRGMRADGVARGAYLRAVRAACDILVLAETNCRGSDEMAWGQEWPAGYAPLWASDSRGRKCRGMAVLVSKSLPQADPTLAYADPEGRGIAVWVTIYGYRTLVIGTHADNTDDSSQAAFYSRIMQALPPVPDGTDVVWLGDMNNVEDRSMDYQRPRSCGERHSDLADCPDNFPCPLAHIGHRYTLQ